MLNECVTKVDVFLFECVKYRSVCLCLHLPAEIYEDAQVICGFVGHTLFSLTAFMSSISLSLFLFLSPSISQLFLSPFLCSSAASRIVRAEKRVVMEQRSRK